MKIKVYIPSTAEYDKYFEKFRAFMSATLSKKARENGVREIESYGCGDYPLRTTQKSSEKANYGTSEGVRDWLLSSCSDAGLRVAFQLAYNPKSPVLKTCKMETRTTKVFDNDAPMHMGDLFGKVRNVTSTAPIVEFDGKKCIWLNKEECESGKAVTMEFWSLDLLDKAEPFDVYARHNDFGKSGLVAQCEAQFSKDALKQILTVEMSIWDGYEKLTICPEDLPNASAKTKSDEGMGGK